MKEDFGAMFGALILICEILTGNALLNLSVGKTSYQTDIYWNGPPANAVDGTVHSYHDPGNCAHTGSTTDAWWEVDLGKIYRIDHVKVFGRSESQVYRLRHVQLYIGYGNSEDDYVLKGYYDGILPVPHTFQLASPVYGRWVRITRMSTVNGADDYLTLCEVEVMGDEMLTATFEHRDSNIGTGVILKSTQALTKTECCAQCRMADTCSAVNYNTVTNVCENLETVSSTEHSNEDISFYRLP